MDSPIVSAAKIAADLTARSVGREATGAGGASELPRVIAEVVAATIARGPTTDAPKNVLDLVVSLFTRRG